MIRITRAGIIVLCLWAVGLFLGASETFAKTEKTEEGALRFVVLGDVPYFENQGELEDLKNKVPAAIAEEKADFTVFLGDFRSSEVGCTEELYQGRRELIYGLQPGKTVYTPGDNDWTDCDPEISPAPVSELKSLKLLRKYFFSERPSFPPVIWKYQDQSSEGFPENAIWVIQNTLFVTIHLVGTNNGRKKILLDSEDKALKLVDKRDAANLRWLDLAFDTANKKQANAVVVFFHADISSGEARGEGECEQRESDCNAYSGYEENLLRNVSAFNEENSNHEPLISEKKPVLIVHGSTTAFCLDQEFGGEEHDELWRFNAWGDSFQGQPVDGSIITVTGDKQEPFRFENLISKSQPIPLCE